MDANEAGRGGYGGDPTDQFPRNEAISAVADDAFVGEEDEDYEDFYNDVNVGENFLQSIRKNNDKLGQKNEEVLNNKANLTSQPPQPVVQSGGVAVQEDGVRAQGYQNVGFGGSSNVNEVGVGRGIEAPGGGGLRVELRTSSNMVVDLEGRRVSNSVPGNQQIVQQQQPYAANVANVGNIGSVNGTGGNLYGGDGVGGGNGGGGGAVVGGVGGGGGGTILFVGDLHWWTTDAELESELCKYGAVKEVKFFDERASGKSKGYCQVEFYDSIAATACKERMNGHIFNGRPCAVAFASPFTVKRMGEAQVNRNQQQIGQTPLNQPRSGPGDLPAKPGGVGSGVAPSGNHQGGGDNNGRGFGRGNWGRGNSQGGMGGRGPMGPMRNRPAGMGIRGNGSGFGQGIGSVPPMLHPQAMMGQVFDPAFGGPMGRLGGYGGFPGGPTAPFSGMLSNFGNAGLPGIAPHVNPAFFGRGMPMNTMGMMPSHGLEGPNMGMWSDPNMGGWGGDEHGGGRVGESSYGEGPASDHQYGEGSQERGPWPNSVKEKDRGSERDWSESSERRHRDDRGAAYDREKDTGRDRERDRDRERSLDQVRDRERHRDDRDSRHCDHQRYMNRDEEYGDERNRGRSSRTHSKSRISHEEEQRSRSRDADYGKRRRRTPE